MPDHTEFLAQYRADLAARQRLEKAALDLLGACKSVLRSINDLQPDPTLEGCAGILEIAIAKAEGKELTHD